MLTTPILTRRSLGAAAAAAAAATALSACGSSSNSGGDSGSTITLGFIPSWTDGLSTAYLLKDQLEGGGYTVELQELTEVGSLYTALSRGDVDLYPSAWSEVTHASYMEQYQDTIDDLGAYYPNARLTWAVPSYSAMTSIEDIVNYKDVLDSTITGIESGSGLQRISVENVLPDYGLDEEGFQVKPSSTQSMVAALSSAIDKEEEIVVTLWRPFWANTTYDVRDLEDPKGSLGDTEGLHFLARQDFSDDFPEVASWVSSISMDDTQYDTLEKMVVEDYGEGRYQEAVQAWAADNPSFAFPGATASSEASS